MPGRIIACPGCLREIRHYARGLCNTCYKRAFHPKPAKNGAQQRSALRLAQHIGSAEAARRLGVDVETFRSWAEGTSKPRVRQLTRLRELLREVIRAERDG